MATLPTVGLDATIRKEFDSFQVFYETDTMKRDEGSRCEADIACISRGETVAGLHFYDSEPIPRIGLKCTKNVIQSLCLIFTSRDLMI